MGLNDLQSQINRLASKTSRQEDIIRDLQTKVATAEQHAATTQQNLNSWAGAGGGGGGNQVEWGRLTSDFESAGPDDPTQFSNYAYASAQLQQTDAVTETLKDMGEVRVFTLDLHNAFKYANSRVSMVKDDVFTAWANEEEGDSFDYYRLTESPLVQDVYCRQQNPPSGSWLGYSGDVYIYENTLNQSNTDAGSVIWKGTSGPVSMGGSPDEWDVRLRTGHPLVEKDLYKGQFWPDVDLLIIDQVACIMALVGSSAVTGSVGCFAWDSLPTDTNHYYPMGKRFSIVGQFAADVASGASAAFHLAKWDTDEDDFVQETIYGKTVPYGDPYDTGTWNIKFASGAVVNVAGFEVGGSATFSASKDIVACQYDEAAGVYLAAPLRCV